MQLEVESDAQAQGLVDILTERASQNVKWGTDYDDRPHAHWQSICLEELGEAAEQVNKLEVDPVLDGDGDVVALRKEVIQLAASALKWLEIGDWS